MLAKCNIINGFNTFQLDLNRYCGNSSQILFIEFRVANNGAEIITQFVMNQFPQYQKYINKELNSQIILA